MFATFDSALRCNAGLLISRSVTISRPRTRRICNPPALSLARAPGVSSINDTKLQLKGLALQSSPGDRNSQFRHEVTSMLSIITHWLDARRSMASRKSAPASLSLNSSTAVSDFGEGVDRVLTSRSASASSSKTKPTAGSAFPNLPVRLS